MKSADESTALGRRVVPAALVLASLLRLGLFVTAVLILAVAVLLGSVRADVTEVLWGVGERIMEYPHAPHERARRLHLNGAAVSFRTQTVDAPLGDVLAHYEALCGTRDARLADRLTSLLEMHADLPSSQHALRAITTQTARSENTGYVACLNMNGATRDLDALATRLLRFSRTGDLREVGDLQYVFARRVASGAGDKTFLFTMWADAEINLYRMLPRAGADAAGHDLVGVPRPSGSERILSAREALQPSGVFVYRVPGKSAQDLEAFYRNELSSRGWAIIERNTAESVAVDGIHMLSAEKEARLVTVLSHSGEGSQTVLTILASEPS